MNLTRLVSPQKVAGEKFKYSQRDVYHHLTLVSWCQCNQYILFGFCCDSPVNRGGVNRPGNLLQSSQVVRSPSHLNDQEKAGDWDDSFETLRRNLTAGT